MTEPLRPGLNGTEPDEDEVEVVTLVDDQGNEQDFVLMDVIEVEGQEYALLVAADDEEPTEDTEAIVLRVEGEDLLPIENEAELSRVAAHLEALANEAEG